MGWCKKDVTPLLTHWSYAFHALSHRNIQKGVLPVGAVATLQNQCPNISFIISPKLLVSIVQISMKHLELYDNNFANATSVLSTLVIWQYSDKDKYQSTIKGNALPLISVPSTCLKMFTPNCIYALNKVISEASSNLSNVSSLYVV